MNPELLELLQPLEMPFGKYKDGIIAVLPGHDRVHLDALRLRQWPPCERGGLIPRVARGSVRGQTGDTEIVPTP